MAFNFFFAVVTEVTQNKYCSKKNQQTTRQKTAANCYCIKNLIPLLHPTIPIQCNYQKISCFFVQQTLSGKRHSVVINRQEILLESHVHKFL